jgi:signal transduction histidine kinase
MNLKKRLTIANAATVVIPVIITVVVALAFIFIYTRLLGADISLGSYQRLTELKLELIGSERSILRQTPEAIEQESFQKYLKERLGEIGGELLIVKDGQVLFSSHDFSKIDTTKFLEAGKTLGTEPVVIGTVPYRVQAVELAFNNGSKGSVLLLAPVEQSEHGLKTFLIVIAIVFVGSFMTMNIYVSYQFSRSILRPLNNLQRAASEISSGNLDCEIFEEGDQELQELCRDLELMRIKLKESIHTQLKYEENRKFLVSSMSHDLKTPVTSIKGYVEGILDGVADTPEKRQRYLQTISLKSQQLDNMLDDLLLYAKLDLQQIPFNFEKTDIAKYLADCVLECEPELERSRIKLTFVNELHSSRYVQLDRQRMKRVIINILDNSRKYMNKEQGELIILLRETNSSVIVELRDNGSGIGENDLPYIFDRFFRSDTARSEIKGSGLGLAIAKQIIEGHNGRVWAVSHGDEGTSILISLSKS